MILIHMCSFRELQVSNTQQSEILKTVADGYMEN